MKNCLFLTLQDARYGFDLTGFFQVVSTRQEVLGELEGYMKKSPPGLIIVDERLLNEKILSRMQVLEKSWGGTVLALPSPESKVTDEQDDYGQRLVTRVLGYQMKLT